MTYDYDTMLAFEKLKTERALTPTPKKKRKGNYRNYKEKIT